MATNNNSDLTKEIILAGRIQSSDSIPNQISNQIVPVIEVNPKILKNDLILCASVKSTTGAQTALTTSATKDTYMTGFTWSIVKDATCDVATGSLSFTVIDENNVTITPARIACLTLTAQNQTITYQFKNPVKLARSSIISIVNDAFTVTITSFSTVEVS